MSIIDTPFNTEASIHCLSSQGVRAVIRYYNFSNSRAFPRKRLELAEAQALSAQGVQIGVVFQQRQDRASDFSVDFDASEAEIQGNVAPYFEGVKRAFDEESGGSPDYRIGACGSGQGYIRTASS
jgi:hypothetical protein